METSLDPTSVYPLARTGAVWLDRSTRGLLRLTGPDRVSFLHGQTTNEVNALTEGSGNDAALLTNKGKMVAAVRVLKRAQDLLVDTDTGMGPAVLDHLQRGCISEEVEFEDLSDVWGQIGVYGPRAPEILRALGAPDALAEHHHVGWTSGDGAEWLVVGSNPWGLGGADLLGPRGQLAGLGLALERAGSPLGLVRGDPETAELLRIHAGVPRFGQDMTEETNPLEVRLEKSISYHKGCYVGQEVIAKATFRGHVSRLLVGLQLDRSAAPGEELKQGDRMVGRITSSGQFPDGRTRALAVVKRDLANPGTLLVATGGGRAVVSALPFPE